MISSRDQRNTLEREQEKKNTWENSIGVDVGA